MRILLNLSAILAAFMAFAQEPITVIPFERFGDHIFIKMSVDDSEPLDVIFDTGAGITVIDEDIADQLELVQHRIVLNEGSVTGSIIKHNTLEIHDYSDDKEGDHLMDKNVKVYATDLDHLEISLGRNIDGIVGYDLLKHHSVRVNYNQNQMEIYEPGLVQRNGDAIPFKLVNMIPVVEGNVVLNNNEPHEGSFFVMSGAGTTLDFNTPYSEEWDVIHKTGKHYSYVSKSISNEETLHYEGHVLSLSFGKQKVSDLPIGISTSNKGIQGHKSVSGIIGNQILAMYNITYDYENSVMYLVKNINFGRPMRVNCSGIDIQLSEDKQDVLIHQVFEDSPASEAGIKLNSKLISLDGETMDMINMADVKKRLKIAGTNVELVVEEDGVQKTYNLELRSLID
ncbi:MAG: aspartyl protease family protein [Cyclobacteriaceae bacterium]